MRVEGKEYLVQDGDVMHLRFNVKTCANKYNRLVIDLHSLGS